MIGRKEGVDPISQPASYPSSPLCLDSFRDRKLRSHKDKLNALTALFSSVVTERQQLRRLLVTYVQYGTVDTEIKISLTDLLDTHNHLGKCSSLLF